MPYLYNLVHKSYLTHIRKASRLHLPYLSTLLNLIVLCLTAHFSSGRRMLRQRNIFNTFFSDEKLWIRVSADIWVLIFSPTYIRLSVVLGLEMLNTEPIVSIYQSSIQILKGTLQYLLYSFIQKYNLTLFMLLL